MFNLKLSQNVSRKRSGRLCLITTAISGIEGLNMPCNLPKQRFSNSHRLYLSTEDRLVFRKLIDPIKRQEYTASGGIFDTGALKSQMRTVGIVRSSRQRRLHHRQRFYGLIPPLAEFYFSCASINGIAVTAATVVAAAAAAAEAKATSSQMPLGSTKVSMLSSFDWLAGWLTGGFVRVYLSSQIKPN